MKQIAVSRLLPLFLLAVAAPAWADTFLLHNGGRVEGELLNADEKPRKSYVVQTDDGAKITLDAEQVAKVVQLSAAQREYEKIRPTFPDTVEGQLELSEWCRKEKLNAERFAHLERVIALEPDHAQARRALGYYQMNGQWSKRDDLMEKRGLIKHNGRWLTQQEIDLAEKKRDQELQEKAWFQKVDRWRDAIHNNRRDRDQALASLQAIKDPAAVKALASVLKRETSLAMRVLFIEILAALDSPEAARVLTAVAVEDANDEIRATCLDYLEKKPNPESVAYFVKELRSKDNAVVNRAARGLQRMKDRSAVGPLIDALVTTHKIKVAGNPGNISTTFGSGGGGGLSAGGGGPKIYTVHTSNQAALDALIALTGTNFNFDKQAWKYWFATQKRPDGVQGRRNQ
jgi:phosphoglycolate phosphatase-like HAD superfamily hydrolase